MMALLSQLMSLISFEITIRKVMMLMVPRVMLTTLMIVFFVQQIDDRIQNRAIWFVHRLLEIHLKTMPLVVTMRMV